MTVPSGKLTIRTHQGVHSTTWTAPPFYGDETIPELYAFHAEKSAAHPAIVYDEDGDVRELRYKELYAAIRRAAHFIQQHVHPPPPSVATEASDKPPVIGILAVSDHITLTALFAGIQYLGYTPFPISVRNPAVTVAHLVRSMDVRHLIVSSDASMQRTAHEVQERLAQEGYSEINLLQMPHFQDFFNDREEGLDVKMAPQDADKPGVILHSSGSTSFPKPITFTHRALTRWGYLSWFGDFDLCGVRASVHCLPMFHIMGAITMPWTLCTGIVAAHFRPSSPPTIVTPETGIQAIAATRCTMGLFVPALLEAWARNPKHLNELKKFSCILYAGAGLNSDVAELFIDQGVNFMTAYGMTEIGALARMMLDSKLIPRKEWMYFSLSPPVEFVRIYQEGLPGVFEFVVVDSPTWSPNAFNTTVNGVPAYATSDLFEEHPENPNLFRVYGRADDQIVLSTGEKTNPVPIEAILLQDPHIHAAIIFGRGRFQNGVFIQPKEPFDPSDDAKLEAFRNAIWPTVERANDSAPSYSRIFKEMIAVTHPDRPFLYTPKGTPRRHVSLAEYAAEIDMLYRRVEEESQIEVPVPSIWTSESATAYVRAVVGQVLRARGVGDHDDLFQQGCDSLQATWIRNTILHGVRTTAKLFMHDVPENFVYLHPTVAGLSAFLFGLVSGKSIDKEAERAARLALMKTLVDKYTTNWPSAKWSDSPANGDGEAAESETVLVTGTTGRVGSHLLSQLVQNTRVARVYALNREASGDAAKLEARQREAMKTWGLDPELLSEGKVVFLPADLSKPFFGFDEKTYAEIQNSVSAILHNAWRVDFNVTLPSFEPLIAGARNLLDLALGSPRTGGPSVLFVSSITSAANHPRETPVLETLDLGPELAIGQGYGESKWVTEQIFRRARRDTGLKTTVVRAGQLSGDTHVGGWGTSEWIPTIVRTSKRLGALPDIDTTISWVPVCVAASALLEMLYSGEPILHLSAPHPVSWNTVFTAVAEHIGVSLVPSSEWLSKLREAAKAGGAGSGPTVDGHDSAQSLLPFFETAMSVKEGQFDTTGAVKVSKTLAGSQLLGKEDAVKWVQFWQGSGFL
ncbi:acetyl-CoA synthetase-like protein [Lenzites betulinus]|nr:acetyl-CoA synthetase-like protein [Lenzites betulinus]